MHKSCSTNRRRARKVSGVAVITGVLAFAGCDLSVTNPGPVQDAFLNDPGAYPAVLQGVRRAHAMGLTRIALYGAMMAREAVPGGLFGTEFMLGTMTSANMDFHWQNMHRARWMAEDGVRRLEGAGNAAGAVYAELLIQAGFANRALGNHMCTAVFDGGPGGDFIQYFERAEGHFTAALAAAQAANAANLVSAARAGRADVRMWRQNWSGAVSDAQAVANEYSYGIGFDALDFQSGANEMYFRQASLPWREYTVWNTFVEGYYTSTGDPRMAWRTNPSAPITMVDNLPFYVQLKFTTATGPHVLASGWEMRLLEAESILVNDPGNFLNAVALINQVRTRNVSHSTNQPLPPVVATNVTEAWAMLKQERRIELWGEARRFGDVRRWTIQNRPGLQPMENLTGRSSCFPVGTSEVNTNPNGLTLITEANTPRFP